jgi:putative two-component system response regulator
MMDKQTVLVVDDTPDNIDVLSGVLENTYKVKAALNGARALKIAAATPSPDLILLDIMMPEMDGYEVIAKLKENPATSNIPVIFVTAKTDVVDEERGFSLGAVDYITKPITPSIVLARVSAQLALYNQNRELENKVQERTKELSRTRLEIIRRLGRAAEFKDNETGMHVIRMSFYSKFMAESLNDNEEWIETLFNAAPMHDIGKIGIPDRVLLKPGKLDKEEWKIMQRHSEFGAEILGHDESDILVMAKEIALNHHEKWDGSGYPRGLKGESIPLSARIVAVADVFDALTSERIYNKAWAVEDAVNLIESESGKHFDPDMVAVFMKRLPDILEIREHYAEIKVEWVDST